MESIWMMGRWGSKYALFLCVDVWVRLRLNNEIEYHHGQLRSME